MPKSLKIFDDSSEILIHELIKDGRIKYTTLAKKLNVTPAAVKERVERLIEKKIIKISALLNPQKIYSLIASIGIEADAEAVSIIIRKIRNCPLVYNVIKTSGSHNLIIDMVAPDLSVIDHFINQQIRSEPGIKHVEVNIGNSLVIPEFLQLRLFHSNDPDYAPCGLRKNDETCCQSCPFFSRKVSKKEIRL
ncbi:MAG: Lrp/AsnC family transcriptional regulator [Candidatus Aenigmatarchaeota archaeon]